jgi:hypothetical protein
LAIGAAKRLAVEPFSLQYGQGSGSGSAERWRKIEDAAKKM